MSTKTVLWSLGGFIIIAGVIYFAKPQSPVAQLGTPLPSQQEEGLVAKKDPEAPTPEPTKDAPSDAIIDYLVDGISADDTKAAGATIDQTTPATSQTTSVNTNF
jgi:hypothetical protein